MSDMSETSCIAFFMSGAGGFMSGAEVFMSGAQGSMTE